MPRSLAQARTAVVSMALAVLRPAPRGAERGPAALRACAMTAGSYRPTAVFDEGVADKLGIPVAYLRRMREADLLSLDDHNLNGWLARDDRTFLVRCLLGDGGDGVARAFFSDRFQVIDHLDTLCAVLDGMRACGCPVRADDCDLTERRLYVRVRCEAVRVLAPLLAGYRSPFTGASPGRQPGRLRQVRLDELRDRVRRLLGHPAAGRPGLRQRDDDPARQ